MAFHVFAGLALSWLHVNPARALLLTEAGPSGKVDGADRDPDALLTNLAEHVRPQLRRSYKKLQDNQQAEVRGHMETYSKARMFLSRNPNMSHSRNILEFVMTRPEAPTLPPGGCLYLPSNMAWLAFYQVIEHPYPPLFVEMVANSYYPDCNATALTGVWLPSSCGSDRMWGNNGCFRVSSLGRVAGIEIYTSEGLTGLPDKWAHHIRTAQPRSRGHRADGRRRVPNATSPCEAGSERLRKVPPDRKLEIPTVYVVCRSHANDDRITHEMVEEQNRWANEAYRGGSPWQSESFDTRRPDSVNMQVEFVLKEVNFVTDKNCAKYGFSNMDYVHRYNPKPLEMFTIVIVMDDQSGVLGQSQFPMDAPENSKEQLVTVSAQGFRGFPSRNEGDMAYDEGDTVIHEAGHGLGLYHTFENGCESWARGDYVDDTAPEALPHYTCSPSKSCGSLDPVHNFMDYSPDTCMMGFTEGQKQRAWCVLEHFRPKLFHASLKHPDRHSHA